MTTSPLTDTEKLVAGVMARHGLQLPIEEITADTSMAKDAHIDGIDVYEFVQDLQSCFGDPIRTIPWEDFSDQRASFYGCQVLSFPFWVLWRLVTKPSDERIIPRLGTLDHPQITVRQIAEAIDAGGWQNGRQQ